MVAQLVEAAGGLAAFKAAGCGYC